MRFTSIPYSGKEHKEILDLETERDRNGATESKTAGTLFSSRALRRELLGC
jgi:hypothetical protein